MQNIDAFGYIAPILILLITALALAARHPNKHAPVLALLFLWIFVLSAHGLVVWFQVVPLFSSGIDANFHITVSLLATTFSFVLWRNFLGRVFRVSIRTDLLTSDRVVQRMIPRWAQWTITAFAFLVLFMMARKAMSIVGTADLLGSMQALRTQLNYEDASWGLVSYLGLVVTVFAVYMFTLTKGQGIFARLPTLLTTFCAIGIAIISTQRTSILLLLIALSFSNSRTGVPSLRVIGIVGAFFISLFISVGFLVGKIGQEGATAQENISFGWNSFLLYILTPLSAFSYSEVWINSSADGAIFLRFFLKVLNSFGLYSGNIPNLVQEYVWVPVPTNVYTFAHMAISDFGSLYFLYYFIVGGILGFVFVFPRRGPTVRALQGFSYYPIVMTVFQDQFLAITSQWVQILIVIYLCYSMTRRTTKPHTLLIQTPHYFRVK